MSSILLSNPFVTPPSAAQSASAEPQTALAIVPTQTGSASGHANDASSFSGNGSGYGGGRGAQAIIEAARGATSLERPADATSDSIVNAQVSDSSADPFGTNLPNVDMPDPLPTSPLLKRMSEAS